MNIFQQISFGNCLTKLTNIVEAIEDTRRTAFIGAGGGIDSFPREQQAKAIQEIESGFVALSKHPKHVVTRELIKNMMVSKQFGRSNRLIAQQRLLEILINNDVALNMEDFEKSYA